jgi:hypothetical protein
MIASVDDWQLTLVGVGAGGILSTCSALAVQWFDSRRDAGREHRAELRRVAVEASSQRYRELLKARATVDELLVACEGVRLGLQGPSVTEWPGLLVRLRGAAKSHGDDDFLELLNDIYHTADELSSKSDLPDDRRRALGVSLAVQSHQVMDKMNALGWPHA